MATKAEQLLESLIEQGFDASWVRDEEDGGGVRVKCSQCEALCINGVACHETGCPNQVRVSDDEDDYEEESDACED